MSYELEAISAADWESLQELSDILKQRLTPKAPRERAINRKNGNFLVEVGCDSNREEWSRRCVWVSQARSLLVTFSNMSNTSKGKLSVSWHPWNGILESEINSMNSEFAEAFKVLYKLLDDQFIVEVIGNPYYVMPRDEVLKKFDLLVDFWFSKMRLEIMYRYTDQLNKGKKTPLKWKFHLTKWRGMPKCEAITKDLLHWTSELTSNPKHLDILLQHLTEGGQKYSDDSKRTLAYIRDHRPITKS